MVDMDIVLKAAERTRRTSIPVCKDKGKALYVEVETRDGVRRFTRKEMAIAFTQAWNKVIGSNNDNKTKSRAEASGR